tara:strand:+ start:2070 stop:2996 length:927 start_codon:yes stop_codon:yes gene_type:complete
VISNIFKNIIIDPVLSLGLCVFYILLISLPFALFSTLKNKSSVLVKWAAIIANILLSLQLISRWIISSHFPISNLFESLCFLSWGLILAQLLLEREYETPIISALTIPLILLTLGFACFVLPDDLRLSSNLVPALRSSWLIMHVSVVMLSYAALIIGSCLSASVLLIDNKHPLQIRSNSVGIGGFRTTNTFSDNKVLNPTEFSHLEKIDTLSYRSILVGFVLLTLGLVSGAVWANEAWGTWWSWDPKETWAFISWLFYAAYLHMRISKGWQGRKPALLASSGFVIVLICYLGVNFWGIGLHSYGWIFG